MKATKRWLVVLLLLCLSGLTWRVVQASPWPLAAGAPAVLVPRQEAPVPGPTDAPLLPTPTFSLATDGGPSNGNWALFGLLLVGGMLLLILYGIGMATLLVKLRKKFDR